MEKQKVKQDSVKWIQTITYSIDRVENPGGGKESLEQMTDMLPRRKTQRDERESLREARATWQDNTLEQWT